jgi:hypothetical protein
VAKAAVAIHIFCLTVLRAYVAQIMEKGGKNKLFIIPMPPCQFTALTHVLNLGYRLANVVVVAVLQVRFENLVEDNFNFGIQCFYLSNDLENGF